VAPRRPEGDRNRLISAFAALAAVGLPASTLFRGDVDAGPRQRQEVAAVEGQFDNTLLVNDGTQSRALGLQQLSAARYFDGFRDSADFHREVDAPDVADLHNAPGHRGLLEALTFRGDAIGAGI
jgi:hypothetical protein